MIRTETFRNQHIEIMSILDRIMALSDVRALRNDAVEVWSMTRRLHDKLTIHLLMEDKVLYPRLVSGADNKLKKLAISFQAEMGGLRNALNIYLATWPTPEAVQDAPYEFIKDSRSFFESVQQRIFLENTELFSTIEDQQTKS